MKERGQNYDIKSAESTVLTVIINVFAFICIFGIISLFVLNGISAKLNGELLNFFLILFFCLFGMSIFIFLSCGIAFFTQLIFKRKFVEVKWCILATMVYCVTFLFVLPSIFNPPFDEKEGFEVIRIYTALYDYSLKYKKYPPAEKWYDILLSESMPFLRLKEDEFKVSTNEGMDIMIAMNPNATPDSPGDVVLLYESIGGWNAHGQAELLAPISHGKNGCYVLFNNGKLKFILSNQIKNLHWGTNPLEKSTSLLFLNK